MLRLFIIVCFLLQGLSIAFAQDGIFHSLKSDFFDEERQIEVLQCSFLETGIMPQNKCTGP